MMRTVTVAEIAAPESRSIAIGPFGSALRAERYTSSGVPVVRGQNIGDRWGLSTDDVVYVARETADEFPACVVRPGDLVFPHRGAIGRVARVDDQEWLLSSSMMKLTVDPNVADSRFVLLYFRDKGRDELLNRASTVGTPGIGQPLTSLRSIPIPLPPLSEQQAIAEVLGALDDKIAANTALAANTASVARVELRSTIGDGAFELPIEEASILLTRGITPRYLPDGEGTRVLNQKCVRDQVVALEPSRWTDDVKVKQEKLLAVGDVLVNSTGQGTLGRVARWTLSEPATVDSHITIVRPDSNVSDPAVIGQAILAIEADIEALGEGSTGQTELSRVELGRARIRIPSPERAERLGAALRALSACQDAARAENATLAAARDALLPQLLSGRLRVRDAEDAASRAGA
ncbi:restriction endonuclease subunit S [Microbacterium sp. I2]|uniref:restriction endonuclease subunit S n=1 Tax=Microbacterium sp. I2 TaxID=3391826 RepID=UPI003ED90096